MSPESAPESREDFRIAYYHRRVRRIAEELRHLADKVEREGTPYRAPSVDGTPRFTNSAERVIHSLMWGFANLNADGIVSAASQADTAEAEATQ